MKVSVTGEGKVTANTNAFGTYAIVEGYNFPSPTTSTGASSGKRGREGGRGREGEHRGRGERRGELEKDMLISVLRFWHHQWQISSWLSIC